METYILYTLFLITGTLLGSFFTLAIHRIPNRENITNKRSYCPKCNHELGFFDLIPVLSYLSLRGKCKYCGEKISPKYLFIELASGIIFLLFAMSFNLNIYSLSIAKIIPVVLGSVYISVLFLIGGLDKKTGNISKGCVLFGVISEAIYIIYLFILNVDMIRYVIYLSIILILIVVETVQLKKNKKANYTLQILTLCSYIALCTREDITIISMILTIFVILIKQLLFQTDTKEAKKKKKKEGYAIPIGAYLCYTNIALLIVENFISYTG